MSRPAIYDDANFILRMCELSREERMRVARDWFGSAFKAKIFDEGTRLALPGSQNTAHLWMVSSDQDAVAAFIFSEALHRDLLFKSRVCNAGTRSGLGAHAAGS